MFLVIDVIKGVQTQTAECLVIGELLIPKMIVVLNKIDQLPEEDRPKVLASKVDALRKVFARSKFGAGVPIVPISAGTATSPSQNVDILIQTVLSQINVPQRNDKGPFFFMIDHCFPLKGQGSVVTGTVIQGSTRIGDEVDFPQIGAVSYTHLTLPTIYSV
eukprot:TRINITY_DN14646_c0_g1_i2.p1 TRINITY_DN14646_c0_g1~~TRINITY_DN14646_c0_g1_i2.p1  ORF type:complete len:161 (-),score=39.33 TRINITY_DN14646_c0_g1_i2:33-515(-)